MGSVAQASRRQTARRKAPVVRDTGVSIVGLEPRMAKPEVRTQSEFVPLTREQFRERFFAKFSDPVFDTVRTELDVIFERAWDGYQHYRKSPRTRAAGPEFADPEQQLAQEWLEARATIQAAEAQHRDPHHASRILVINGSTRSEHTCPGEISKTLRLTHEGRGGGPLSGLRRRSPRSVGTRLRAVEGDSSVQGVRLDVDASLPLAVFVLSESCTRADQRLDE